MVKLEFGSGGDPECPHCKTRLYVGWDNEYGDPELGRHEIKCLNCNKEFTLECHVEFVTYPEIFRDS